MRILINSYTCCPGMGSEQGMGWNWIVSLARYCEVFVISEGEYKSQVEDFISLKVQEFESSNLPADAPERFAERMHFYWNPVPQSTRDKCWNQGNWSFYPLYAEWQKKTADIAREICKEHKIDILHQLNMIGFREPGFLADVSKETGIPLVWGPVDAKSGFPMAYTDGASLKMKAFLWIKNVITLMQLKWMRRVHEVVNQSSCVVSASSNSQKSFKQYFGIESPLINETGCNIDGFQVKCKDLKESNSSALKLLWVGKMDFRKQLGLAIQAVAALKELNIELHVVGGGDEIPYKGLAQKLGVLDQVVWYGMVNHDKVQELMQTSDILLFTSVAEGTPHVVLEAIANGLPVVCFDTCGQGDSVNDKVGAKISLTNPAQSVQDFAEQISFFYDNREELSKRSDACSIRAEELSWDNKARKMMEIYEGCCLKVRPSVF